MMMRSDFKKRSTVNSTIRAPSSDTFEGVRGSISPHCVSDKSGCFKENINTNKSEAPKLAVEPLQMKRKKKGGGYNLRKSLAWDRAFFTEEGVLDPEELSVISSGASCEEGLASINEDTPGGSHLSMKTVDLENSISKNRPGEDDRKKDCSSGNLDSTTSSITRSTSLVSHKVPTHVGGKSGFRSGDCPRPSSSSSLKRPAHVNVGKASGKELKLPKVPGLKPSFSPICGTNKRNILGVNCVKHNQIAQPDINIQGIVGLKNSKILKNNQIASKASSLPSVSNGDGNLGNSSFRRHSSANVSPALVDKVDSFGSKRSSDCNTTLATLVNSSGGLTISATSAAPLAQNAQLSGRTMHHLQNQPMKPSGLRMPSPSLSFFTQLKRPVHSDLPLRDRTSDVCGSQKTGHLRLQDNLRTTPKMDYEILESTIRSNKSLGSRSDCMTPCHHSFDGVTKLNLESSSMQKVGTKEQLKKGIAEIVSSEEAELHKIDIEVPSLGETHENVMEDNFVKVIGNSPIKSESCQSGCRYPELRLEHNNAIHKSEKDNKLDDRMHNSLMMLSDWHETCKSDCHESHMEKAEHFKYCQSENKRTSVETLGYSPTQTEDSYIVAKQLHADLLNEAAVTDTSTNNLSVVEANKQNAVSGGTNSKISFILEDCNVDKQSGDGSEVEKESCGNAMLTTSERMLLEKHTCLQNTQLENNAENLLPVVPIKKDGNKLIKPTPPNLLSSGKMHDCSSDEDFTTKPLASTESDSVDNLVSLESYDNSRNPFNCDGKNKDNANSDASVNETTMPAVSVDGGWQDDDNLRRDQSKNVMLNSSPRKNWSNSLHQDAHRKEIGHFSSSPESRTHEVVSLDNNLEKVREVGPSMQDDSASNWLTSLEMLSNERICDMYNLRDIQESGILMVEKEACLCSPEPSISAQESPLKHDSSNIASGQSPIADALASSSRVEPFSDPSNTEVSEVSVSPFSCLHPVLEHVKVEAESTPSNKHEDGVDGKTQSFVLPQNAVPFSDEWLAAIEAAGEDILTKKGGAVQNSPPDKSLPEPSPWSPVKKKNNQIGPFDCTKKFSNVVHPSDSN